MNKDLLRTAQHALRIDDVALRESQTRLADDYEPKYDNGPAEIQYRCATQRSELIELSNEDDQHRKVFRVFVDLGIRWVRPVEPEKDKVRDGDESKADPSVLARIEATFVAEYVVTEEVLQDALNEFALHNAPWHVWPFWREYVASQCGRMNLTKVAMPMQFAAAQPQNEHSNS